MRAAVLAVAAAQILEGLYGPSTQLSTVDTKGTPVVVLHGMGDASTNPGMGSLCKSITKQYPGVYVLCSAVGNGLGSITTKLAKQVEEFASEVQSDPQLKDGFHVVGLSQGNMVLRAYVEQVNNPPVKTFVSICGTNNGIANCPNNILYKLVCPLWKLDKYSASIAFSDYWKDPMDKAQYLQKSRFLADLNNERDQKNATYKANMLKLEKYVLVMANGDNMVDPKESEQFGYYKWGSMTEKEEMRDTEAYQGDWIGLKTLDLSHRIDEFSFDGDHLQFSQEFWAGKILPYFAPKSENVVV